ncbi:hypothetical protein BKA80DRAFT_121711 [Phyllosticta citrichinensis]
MSPSSAPRNGQTNEVQPLTGRDRPHPASIASENSTLATFFYADQPRIPHKFKDGLIKDAYRSVVPDKWWSGNPRPPSLKDRAQNRGKPNQHFPEMTLRPRAATHCLLRLQPRSLLRSSSLLTQAMTRCQCTWSLMSKKAIALSAAVTKERRLGTRREARKCRVVTITTNKEQMTSHHATSIS